MTKPIINNITTASDMTKAPLKIALVGLTMIQRAILEFYFATQEGAEKFTEVLGKDAEAYITNFDELGAIEAWENLYAQENKPTLVLSNCRKDEDNYLYFPRPITPNSLQEGAELLNKLLGNNALNKTTIPEKPTSMIALAGDDNVNEFISEKVIVETKSDDLSLFEGALNEDLNVFETLSDLSENEEVKTVEESLDRELEELTSFGDLAFSPQTNEKNTPEALSLDALSEELNLLDELAVETESKEFDSLEDLILDTENDKLTSELTLDEPISLMDFSPDSMQLDSLLDDEELSLDKVMKEPVKPEIEAKVDDQACITLEEKTDLSLDNRLADQKPLQTEEVQTEEVQTEEVQTEEVQTEEVQDDGEDKDKFTSPEELQSFLDDLNEKKANQDPNEKKAVKSLNSNIEKLRWIHLCGKYKDDSYDKNAGVDTRFKLGTTLFPYVADTVSFTKRAECWMELSYKPLSLIINPDKNIIYSNLSLENPLFVQICRRNIVEELIEYLEVDEKHIEKIKTGQLESKLFSYDLRYFTWTLSLLVSRGRLPEDCNPDEKMRIINWLSLSKVEKFPYIMQIAAVFNQHHASLNEAASWMTLPKRYVYAFYNGVLALDMIDKKKEEANKKKLIAMGSNNESENSLTNMLFKKMT